MPIDLEHPDDYVEDHCDITEDCDDSGGEHLVERVDIRSQPRHEPANRVAIVKVDRQLLQMREDLFAQVVHYVLPHCLHHDGLGVLNCERCDIGDKEDKGDESDSLIRAGAKAKSIGKVFQEQCEP